MLDLRGTQSLPTRLTRRPIDVLVARARAIATQHLPGGELCISILHACMEILVAQVFEHRACTYVRTHICHKCNWGRTKKILLTP